MRAISDLFRSLGRLTGISAFYDIANMIYKVQRTQREIESVKRNAEKVKDSVSSKND